QEEAVDLAAESPEELLNHLGRVTRLTLDAYARDSLKPTVLASLAVGNLERGLIRTVGKERTREALGELMMGVRPDPDADLPGAVEELAAGRLDRATFLRRFGH